MSKSEGMLWGYNYDTYPYDEEEEEEIVEMDDIKEEEETLERNDDMLATDEVQQICPEIYYGYEVCDHKEAGDQICQNCLMLFWLEKDACPSCGYSVDENIRIQLEMKRLDELTRISTESFQNAMNLIYHLSHLN